MKTRLLSVFMLTVSLLTTSPANNQSQARQDLAGIKCFRIDKTKVISGITFKCSKKGKNLVWRKEKVIDNPVIEKSRYREALDIQKYIDTANLVQLNSETKVNWYFQSNLNQDYKNATKLGLEKALEIYQKLGFTTNETSVFVADDESEVRKLIAAAGCSLDRYNPAMGFISVNSCPDGRVILVARSYPSLNLNTSIDKFDYQHVLAHEYAHQLQYELHTRFHQPIPIWMTEGGAQFLTSVAYSTWNQNRKYEDHLNYISAIWRKDIYEPCFPIRVQDVPFNGAWEDRKCGYSKGAKAVEFLVSKYGFKGYMDILKGTSSNSFENAFQTATGNSLQSFYEQLEVFFKDQGWSPKS
ncbi:MAG: hypothetical protein ACKN9L_06010 [Actinomycetota bacterium]